MRDSVVLHCKGSKKWSDLFCFASWRLCALALGSLTDPFAQRGAARRSIRASPAKRKTSTTRQGRPRERRSEWIGPPELRMTVSHRARNSRRNPVQRRQAPHLPDSAKTIRYEGTPSRTPIQPLASSRQSSRPRSYSPITGQHCTLHLRARRMNREHGPWFENWAPKPHPCSPV